MRRILGIMVIAAAVTAGCQKATPPAKGTTATATATAKAEPGYRSLSQPALEALLKSKCGYGSVTLKPAGADKYTGTVTAPDGTTLPVTVTLTDDLITAETTAGGLTTRNTIDAKGNADSKMTGG